MCWSTNSSSGTAATRANPCALSRPPLQVRNGFPDCAAARRWIHEQAVSHFEIGGGSRNLAYPKRPPCEQRTNVLQRVIQAPGHVKNVGGDDDVIAPSAESCAEGGFSMSRMAYSTNGYAANLCSRDEVARYIGKRIMRAVGGARSSTRRNAGTPPISKPASCRPSTFALRAARTRRAGCRDRPPPSRHLTASPGRHLRAPRQTVPADPFAAQKAGSAEPQARTSSTCRPHPTTDCACCAICSRFRREPRTAPRRRPGN